MHLLYVIDSLSGGGAEQSLAALAPCYAARGVRLEVAYLHERPGVHAQLEEAGARLFCIAGGGGRAGWIRRATSLAKARRPELIHTTLFESDVAGRIAGRAASVPVVSSIVNVAYGPEQLDDPNLHWWKLQGARLADAATARLAVRFHSVSGHVADVMSRRLAIRRNLIDVVHRGRDPSRLGTRSLERRERARAELGVDEETALVLAAARQERQKGLEVLIEAFPLVLHRVPQARLAVAGREGNQTPELQRAVEHLEIGEFVRFLGARSDLPDLLCAADVFVFPSRWEGLPGTIIEAMALEAPIVASDIPTVREVVSDGGDARLVPVGQPEPLAAGIVTTLKHPGRARERSRSARARFLQRFTIEQSADGMIAFYERALAGRHS